MRVPHHGWRCGHDAVAGVDIEASGKDPAYPPSWPNEVQAGQPLGIIPLSLNIKRDADHRIQRVRHDFEYAGPFYSRDQVRAVLDYWNIAF